MTVVPTPSTPIETSAVKLARYAAIIGIDECRFWGVNGPTPATSCRTIWTLQQRRMVAKYLAEAQTEIEQIINYPIGVRWFVEKKKVAKTPLLADWGYVIQGGVMAVSDISIGEAVDQTSDPAVIGPIATTVTDIDEVKVYHPGTDIEIDPSSIEITGGNLTIEVPRCRTVLVALADNPEAGLSYSNLANFEATVDVKRVYNDPSTNAVLSTNHTCNTQCNLHGCTDTIGAGCIYVAEPIIGNLQVYPATYSSGWTRTSVNCCNNWHFMQLNYQAGKELDYQAEDAIVRLAHAKMPIEPCGCDPAKWVWQRDRKVPEVLTSERLNCAFGLQDGAYFSWQQAHMMRIVRSGVLA